MKAYVGVEAKLIVFLASALDGDQKSVSRSEPLILEEIAPRTN
jgi:hypothetical protein